MKRFWGLIALCTGCLFGAEPPAWLPDPAARMGEETISRAELFEFAQQQVAPPREMPADVAGLKALLTPHLTELESYCRLKYFLEADGIPCRQPLGLTILAWCDRRYPGANEFDDRAVEDFYRRNQTAFLVPEHRSLLLLLIDRTDPEAEEKLATVNARLQQGEPFAELQREFDAGAPEARTAVLQYASVKQAMRALPSDDPQAYTPVLATPKFYVIGQATVFPAHYRPLDDELRREIHAQLRLTGAMQQLQADFAPKLTGVELLF